MTYAKRALHKNANLFKKDLILTKLYIYMGVPNDFTLHFASVLNYIVYFDLYTIFALIFLLIEN